MVVASLSLQVLQLMMMHAMWHHVDELVVILMAMTFDKCPVSPVSNLSAHVWMLYEFDEEDHQVLSVELDSLLVVT